MDAFEDLSRKLAMIEARIASYERLHAEELAELKTMLQSLKMQSVAIQSQAAHEAALRLDGADSTEVLADAQLSANDRDEAA